MSSQGAWLHRAMAAPAGPLQGQALLQRSLTEVPLLRFWSSTYHFTLLVIWTPTSCGDGIRDHARSSSGPWEMQARYLSFLNLCFPICKMDTASHLL